ncbi:MAG: ADP-ribosylglycohydrolase family protein [Methylotenera sp.]|nr:ADP-ribosylglycohydrolase family protein [Methylotenera sp.]
MKSERIDRARGCLLGLAIGDAIGTTVEFKPRGSFTPMTDMVGGGPFQLKAGEWTDDTSMALCLGASLLEKGFDLHDQITKYVKWYREGYMSSTGRCFDIGIATREALNRFNASGNPESGSINPRSAGNGCIMRLAPVPIMYVDHPVKAAQLSAEQSKTTHGATECIEASQLFGEILVRALEGTYDKNQILNPEIKNTIPYSSVRIQSIADGGYFEYDSLRIKGTGYVVDSLEAALWCFYITDNFKDAVLTAANLGDDADTTAAITGQIAGAYYGEMGIPQDWLDKVVMAREIGEMAEQLSKAGVN